MSVKLLTEQHLEVLSLKGGCIGSSESLLVKMPLCWKSHVVAHMWASTQDFCTYIASGSREGSDDPGQTYTQSL